jgi:hypothetical protein
LDEQEINLLLNNTSRDEYGEEKYKWNELDKCTYKTIDLLLNIYRDLFILYEKQHDNLLRTLICLLTQSNVPREQSKTDFDCTIEPLIEYPNYLKSNYIDKLIGALKYFIQNRSISNSTLEKTNVDSFNELSCSNKNNTPLSVSSIRKNSLFK